MKYSKIKFLTFFAIICSIGLAPINDAYAAIDNPTATSSFDDGDSDGSGGTFDELDGANGITTVVIGSNTYALVASSADDGVQIIDITTPGSPTATASFDDGDSDGSGGTFDELDYAHGITTVVIGSNTYALVTSSVDNGVQIIGLDVVTADSTTTTKKSSDCYDCKPPVLQSSHITILTNDYVVATGDDPIHITANVGDKVTVILNVTDNKSVDTIPFAALYTNYQEKPSDMSAFYANNFDKWKHVSTSFYEWNVRADDVPYDYDGTVSWSDNAPTVVTDVTTADNFKFKNDDNNMVEYFMVPFTFTINDFMEESAITAKIYDASGNRLHVTLPVTLKVAGNEPLNFDYTGKQKVLGFYDESVLSEMVETWSESESDTKQMSSLLGISDESLPPWTSNLATWVAEGAIDSADLIVAVEYLINQ